MTAEIVNSTITKIESSLNINLQVILQNGDISEDEKQVRIYKTVLTALGRYSNNNYI